MESEGRTLSLSGSDAEPLSEASDTERNIVAEAEGTTCAECAAEASPEDVARSARPEKPQKYIGRYEMISYIVGTCSLSAFMGLVNNYRGDYLNNVIMLSESNQQILNIVTTVVGYLLGFFAVNFIDNFRSKHGKFRPLALVTCIPYAIFGFFMFFTPFDANSAGGMIWIISVVLIYNLIGTFSGAENNVAIVMTPIEKERNSLFATNSFFTSIFSQTSLVLILGLGIARSQGVFDKNTMYFIALAILGVIYVVGTINAMLKTKERLVYTKEKASIFAGMRDVLKNKNFWWLTFSHQIRNFRSIGTGFGIYIAGCLLGSTDNYIWVGLPTGIGTFVGMLIVQKLIKRMDPIKVYWIFGIISLIVNALAFGAGYLYLTIGGTALQIVFVFFLFTIGLQYGSSNIIPNIFNADILNELEYDTNGKRLEQTITFTQSLFGTVMGVVMGILSPMILLTVCGYQQGVDVVQTQSTSIKLLFFYTIFAGIFFFVSLFPMLGYKLNTKRREELNAALEIQREERRLAGVAVADEGTPDINELMTAAKKEHRGDYPEEK